MHTQVVLCPGINDGPHLVRTLDDLQRFHPFVETVALVPVGLTQYRERLPVLRLPDRDYARALLAWVKPRRRLCLKQLGTRLAFPSDEFYLLADEALPSGRTYEGYPQLGNGVGGSRKFLDDFRRYEKTLPNQVSPDRKVTVITGMLAASVLAGVVDRLNRVRGLTVHLMPIPNTFFGGSVTCAGLLTGSDLSQALEPLGSREDALGDEILLPGICLKDGEDIFLDDVRLVDLCVRFQRPIVRVEPTARALLREVLKPAGTRAAGPGGYGVATVRASSLDRTQGGQAA